jgi:NADPH:quinone reductase-like Zn-dependent oxidoreductase
LIKAARYARYGAPEDVIEVVEIPDESPDKGQALLDVEAVSIWPHDLYSMQNLKGFEERLPHIPGNKCIGTVGALGAGVTHLKEGDRVNVTHIAPGTWRERVCLDAENLRRVPANADVAQLSLLGNMLTSYYAFEDIVPLKKGDWIIQNGANSSCGQFIIQMAKLRGIHTVNVVRRPEIVPYLREIGGDVVLVDGPDLARDVTEATNDAPIPLAIDLAAGDATQRLADCVAQDGTVACYGLMSDESAKIMVSDLMLKSIRLVGYFMGHSRRNRSHEEFGRVHDDLADLVADGVLFAQIAAEYPLDAVKAAVIHQAKESTERPGKIILRPNATAENT